MVPLDEMMDVLLDMESGFESALEHSCECATPEGEARCKHCNLWNAAMEGARRRLKELSTVSAIALPELPSEGMADAVRGILQIIRGKPGATFDEVLAHCEARGDDTGRWPLWVQDAEGYVTEQAAAMMIFEIMDKHRYDSRTAMDRTSAGT